jgi:hypothetical protein
MRPFIEANTSKTMETDCCDRLKKDFVKQFCIAGTNKIDWEKLVRYVSDIPVNKKRKEKPLS